jgi:hypothetical protein
MFSVRRESSLNAVYPVDFVFYLLFLFSCLVAVCFIDKAAYQREYAIEDRTAMSTWLIVFYHRNVKRKICLCNGP